MRLLKFEKPNFRCTVVDAGGNADVRLENAMTEAEVQQRLIDKGYTIQKVEDYRFGDWETKALRETDNVILARRNGQQHVFANAVWSELKQYLFSLSRDKCAYCEGSPLPVSSGDVEHYRPKKKVEEDEAHGGYYWLAYDITNLLPCCEKCNRARAKMNHFPLDPKSRRAKGPRDSLKKEEPLLINPFETDPAGHLKFITGGAQNQLGTIVGTTPAGKQSVSTYNLNRGDLVTARREAIVNFRLSLDASILKSEYMEKTLRDLRMGIRDYSTILMLTFREWWEDQKANVEQHLNG